MIVLSGWKKSLAPRLRHSKPLKKELRTNTLLNWYIITYAHRHHLGNVAFLFDVENGDAAARRTAA
jgi:lysozyme family protein